MKEYRIKILFENVNLLLDFFKKFLFSTDETSMFELKDNKIIGKIPSENRDIIKYSYIDLNEITKEYEENDLNIKIPIYNFKKFLNILKLFNDDFDIILFYDKEKYDNKIELITKKIVITNNILTYNILCSNYEMIIKVTDERFNTLNNKNDKITEIFLSEELLEKIIYISKFDDSDILMIKSENSKIYFKGKSFSYAYQDYNGKEFEVLIDKNNLINYLDKTDYNIYIFNEIIKFESLDKKIIVIIATIFT